MRRGTQPSVRSHLAGLTIPRWYLQGGLSDPEPELERDLTAMGAHWAVVPETGHPMGLQNPLGLAESVARAVGASWSSP
jgi:hypothetical protein